jgi:hypothetical protein
MLPMWGKVIAVVSALAVFTIGKFYFHLNDNNPVEQMAEKVIEEETGIDIEKLEEK